MNWNVWWQPIYLLTLATVAFYLMPAGPSGLLRTGYLLLCGACIGAASVMCILNIRDTRKKRAHTSGADHGNP